MKKHHILALIIITQAATGCSLLKLHPDPPPEDEITISWEESKDEQLVIKYSTTRKKKGDTPPDKTNTTSSGMLFDTVSSKHIALFLEIDSWLGTPYGYGRSDKNGGTDCSGLTLEIYKTVYGINLNRSSEGQVANTVEIKKEQLEIGDLVFFVTKGSRISHVGIYIGNNKFVHSSTQRGVVINDLDERYYKERYVRSGRIIK